MVRPGVFLAFFSFWSNGHSTLGRKPSVTGTPQMWALLPDVPQCGKRSYRDTQRFVTEGAVAMSSVNGLVGTGFVSQYRLQPRAGV